MPDSGGSVAVPAPRMGEPAGAAPASIRPRAAGPRWASPLLRRILLVNALPLALLVAALLYLDQYQNGLLEAEVQALREQARIYAGALGESAVREQSPETPTIQPDLARPLLRRLTEPTPNAQARLYAPDGQLIADSRVREGAGDAVVTEPLPPAAVRSRTLGTIGAVYDRLMSFLPHQAQGPYVEVSPNAAGIDWQPNVKEELRMTGSNSGREMPPYIRRTEDDRLLVTVAEPVLRNRRHGRHRAADPRGAGGGRQPADGADEHPGIVRPGDGADGGAVLVLVADHRAPDPAPGRRRARDAGRPRTLRHRPLRAAAPHGRGRAVGPCPDGERGGAVGPHGRDRAVRRRRGARDQEPAQQHPQRHRDAAPHRQPGGAAPPGCPSSRRT